MPEKRATLMINDELQKEAKIHCVNVGISLKAFVEYLINKELKRIKEKKA